MLRTVGLIMLMGLLGACLNSENEPTENLPEAYAYISFAAETATRRERARCEAAGGEVRRDGMAGWEQCIQIPPDAGLSCSDSSECADRCMVVGEFAEFGMATTGQCSSSDSPFGCYQTVEGGVAEPAICVD
ncbi:MAG: hypothetical protein VXW22_00885 [Pseudomonadota bacterium]|jgi:hypothetical protein|nr:hypothetical protein [Pseudomonadota bacterium]